MATKCYNIAVLLTCYNRKEKTLNCLKSLFETFLPDNVQIEVFLVDDGSLDGTGSAVKKRFPLVNIIQGDGNLFWSKGMNLAWQKATETLYYDFYLWLNDDVILFKESIINLLNDVQKTGSNESILVGVCQSATGKITYSGYKNLKKKIKLIPNGDIQKCDYFNGNLVLIPSCVFAKVGFLDPMFHHGKGDFDYGLRAKESGVNSYISSQYLGVCEVHDELPVWCNPKYPLKKRIKSFKSPLGGNPRLTFIIQRKYLGLIPATFHYVTIHLRLVCPSLWKK